MIFLDSGLILAYVNKDDPYHGKVINLMDEVLKGRYGKIVTSNFVVDEAITLAMIRTKKCDCSEAIIKLLDKKKEGNPIFFQVNVDQLMMKESVKKFLKYCENGMSFTDCSILAVTDFLYISHLATLDSHFKGLIAVLPE